MRRRRVEVATPEPMSPQKAESLRRLLRDVPIDVLPSGRSIELIEDVDKQAPAPSRHTFSNDRGYTLEEIEAGLNYLDTVSPDTSMLSKSEIEKFRKYLLEQEPFALRREAVKSSRGKQRWTRVYLGGWVLATLLSTYFMGSNQITYSQLDREMNLNPDYKSAQRLQSSVDLLNRASTQLSYRENKTVADDPPDPLQAKSLMRQAAQLTDNPPGLQSLFEAHDSLPNTWSPERGPAPGLVGTVLDRTTNREQFAPQRDTIHQVRDQFLALKQFRLDQIPPTLRYDHERSQKGALGGLLATLLSIGGGAVGFKFLNKRLNQPNKRRS